MSAALESHRPDGNDPRWTFRNHGGLHVGRVYTVVYQFEDLDLRPHYFGEEWTFLTARPTPSGVAVWVRHSETGALDHLQVPEKLHLSAVVQRRAVVPSRHVFRCGCEPPDADWAEVYAARSIAVHLCCRCGLVIALEAKAEGSRIVPMSDAERAAVERVIRLPFDVKLPELLEAALECRSYPANLMLGTLLERRSNLEGELVRALRAPKPEVRSLALRFLATLDPVPRSVETELVRVLHEFPEGMADGDVARLLRTLETVAESLAPYRGRIAELGKGLRQRDTADARAARASVQTILKRIDQDAELQAGKRSAAVAVLRTLAARRDFDEAERWLEVSIETTTGNDGLQRAMMCESAADRAGKEDVSASRWLYRRALSLFEEYATSSGLEIHESRLRLRHVQRLSGKLEAAEREPSTPPRSNDTPRS